MNTRPASKDPYFDSDNEGDDEDDYSSALPHAR